MDIQNTQVGHWPLTLTQTDPATGTVTTVPVPQGDTFSATSSSTSLAVSVGPDAGGNQELITTPMVVESSPNNGGGNIVVTVTDSAGDVAGELSGADAINIVPTPVTTVIRLGTPTFTTQPVPATPGP